MDTEDEDLGTSILPPTKGSVQIFGKLSEECIAALTDRGFLDVSSI